ERDKVDPLRIVRKKPAPLEVVGKKLLTIGDALLDRRLVQPCSPPRRFLALHNERAGVAVERVAVNLKQAVFVLAEDEGKRVENLIGAEPDILGGSELDRRLENRGEGVPSRAVDPIGRDNQ